MLLAASSSSIKVIAEVAASGTWSVWAQPATASDMAAISDRSGPKVHVKIAFGTLM
jgi:hypothetical protein